MAFNDGEPIDASKLAELEQKVLNLAASIPKFGTSGTTINVQNPNPVNAQTIIGKAMGTAWTLVPGTLNKLPVTFDSPLTATPRAIILTTRKADTSKWHPQVDLQTGTSSAFGFTAICFLPKEAEQQNVYLSYMAIVY